MIMEIVGAAPDAPFKAWCRNVHSQCGEDGIIEQLLKLAGLPKGYFIEFGAWDGRHLSNCAKLADEGWSGCFIEGNPERFADLEKSYADRPEIKAVNAFVGTKGNNALSAILRRVDAPKTPTVLSIDIDGNDYHVWAALEGYHPQLCIIEFNPTIPTHVLYVQDDEAALNRGASLTALFRLGQQKGYRLVAATEWNAFFMPEALCQQHHIATYTPEQVKDRRLEAALFHGFDGTMLVAGHRKLVWQGISYGPEDLQILPAELRSYADRVRTEQSSSQPTQRALREFRRLRKAASRGVRQALGRAFGRGGDRGRG